MALDYEADHGTLPASYEELERYTEEQLEEIQMEDYIENNDIRGFAEELGARMYEHPEEAAEVGMRFSEIAGQKPLICLGIVNGVAALSDQIDDELEPDYTVHYDLKMDEDDVKKLKFDMPHISMEIDGLSILDSGNRYDHNEPIEEEQLADLYGMALGVKELETDQDIETSNSRMVDVAKNAMKRARNLGQQNNYMTGMAAEMIEDFENQALKEDEENRFITA